MYRCPHPLFRAVALAGVLGVMLLTLLAASPGWHAELHDHGSASEHSAEVPVGQPDHVCAVTLWASGAVALLMFCLFVPVRPSAGRGKRAADVVIPSLPRYRLVPSHAPPSV